MITARHRKNHIAGLTFVVVKYNACIEIVP